VKTHRYAADNSEPHAAVGRLLTRHYISISRAESTMKKTTVFVASIVFCTVGSVYADSTGGPGGTWPKSWPKQLEPLRKQASTWVGGEVMNTRHEIPFANRGRFESAWPHILKLKSKGAPLTLLSGPHFYGRSGKTAGVLILPPLKTVSAGPLSVTRIVLVVDGDIVDLNRIRLPADTPIIDKRFTDRNNK